MRAKIEGNLDASARPHVDIAPLSDREIRERLAVLRERGLLRPPINPEQFAVAAPRRLPIPCEADGLHSPRTAVAVHAAELADRCRCAASLLEAVAANVPNSQPSRAKEQANTIVRALVRALSDRVFLTTPNVDSFQAARSEGGAP